ncbi:hypothetical protein TWF970_007807 [Orbilia oligospora]|uniref:Uncharacterized protein n=1 Tax=Orbilia oligospora TaxID=2813651 RepID=A0A7C8V4S7_ORBOL|nr:hypothetical protein TWF970_007807 [Orbilia oligospora]
MSVTFAPSLLGAFLPDSHRKIDHWPSGIGNFAKRLPPKTPRSTHHDHDHDHDHDHVPNPDRIPLTILRETPDVRWLRYE